MTHHHVEISTGDKLLWQDKPLWRTAIIVRSVTAAAPEVRCHDFSSSQNGSTMSDTSQGNGWWQASDGKWYPGQQTAALPQHCTNCAAPVAPGAAACMSCGFSPVAQGNYCAGCGTATAPGQVVCTSCGRAVTPGGSSGVVSGQYGDKSKIAAGLLGIFLGAFGVHKFYLARNTPALIMLLVSIVAGIVTLGLATAIMGTIGLIEGIIYLTKTDQEFYDVYVVQGKDWF